MKFMSLGSRIRLVRSHPTRGGWIEICLVLSHRMALMSHPTRGGWIEIVCGAQDKEGLGSHPTRGGWIEMSDDREAVEQLKVPPHTGWVD